ncbi:MAG TPA: arsenic resistance N-acetyltransferase ArsN2, partial [Albitalea sp.]|uniref:arsenic resistance N-acetyltransferase ArsN2 n=1 Tax=Piscinibacter sp. TaxID=1903157 RepID=UPI002ED2DE52
MLLNPTNIRLRQAGAADWDAIASLLEANKLPLDGARDHLSTYVVAVAHGEVVGSAGVEIYGDVALLRSVAVAPALYRQGVGKAMVGLILDEARRRGIRSLHLLSVTAPEYFAQFGFKRGPRDKAPAALQASAEFQGACPACSAFMTLPLVEAVSVQSDLPVAVIGAGPVGLAAAARLLERGITPLILEAGAKVGANLADYAHVRLFSPWRYNVDHAVTDQLRTAGWIAPPPEELPLAGEIVERVLRPFAALPDVAPHLHLNKRVVAISREGFDKVKTVDRDKAPFVIRAVQDGREVEFRARSVIDASGTWSKPNPLGANGLPAIGERELSDAIFYGIPDVLGAQRARYAGKRTLVVGAGHSAANALLSLADLAEADHKTQLAWAVRSPSLQRVFGGGESDALPARGRLGTQLKALRDRGGLEFVAGLRITELRREGGKITVEGINAKREVTRLTGIDQIICATGQRPDLTLSAELRLKLDPWLESTEALGPLIDPNVHSCGTVRPHGHRELSHPEAGFYTIGVKSYGRAPTFLMATGYEQARSVVAAIAGDLVAADRVELELPETGVCSLSPSEPDAGSSAESGCCGPATSEPVLA